MIKEPTSDALAKERTLLAAERTFSAWIRTGLAGMAGGLAIVRLITFQSFPHRVAAHVIGALLIIWGGTVFLFALLSYRRTRATLVEHDVDHRPLPVLMLLTSILIVVAVIVLWMTI